MPKFTFSMIVFNGAYLLKENLENIYPYAKKIVITEGPVRHYQNKGYTQSTDGTLEIIKNFPDPDNKIVLLSGTWLDKDTMVRVQEKHYETGYIWCVDSDEFYKKEDIEKVSSYLDKNPNCHSMSFRLMSFYGGFDHYITGYEQIFETQRIKKFMKGKSRWKTHRPPTMLYGNKTCKELGHINHDTTTSWGIYIYHYSHVFPKLVKAKMDYYKSRDKNGIIGDYFNKLYVPWMRAVNHIDKLKVEAATRGVQENVPGVRGDAYTAEFKGEHPEVIKKSMPELKKVIEQELKELGVK